MHPGGDARFTDEGGRFAIAGLLPGRYTVRARQLGFSPADTTVVIERGAPPPTLDLELVPIVLRLAEVRVTAPRECTAPGPPDSAAAPQLHVIFEQLRENALRYRLLADAHPFVYRVERTFATTIADTVVGSPVRDTIVLASRADWRYTPGRMVRRERGPSGALEESLLLPTLPVFADTLFHRHHCFDYRGLERIEGEEQLRIDFDPAVRLRDPDVSGSVWLDPESYQVRRADIRLTRVPRRFRSLESLSATTTYREVLPSIVIVAEVTAASVYRGSRRRPAPTVTELQRLLSFAFVSPDSAR